MSEREIIRARHGSMVVQEHLGNMEIAATHQGGIVHQGRVVIERADYFDLFCALKDFLSDRMCLSCGSDHAPTICPCENDE